MAWERYEVHWGQHRIWGGHVGGACEGEHMVVAWEAVGEVESTGGVSRRVFGVRWLVWVWGW